jgi:L-ascorbate metabolism protein UlaG (beta-lactamase superfamily)
MSGNRYPLALAALMALGGPASAAEPEPERCPRFVAEAPSVDVAKAAYRVAAVEDAKVTLTFVGHATFLIESPAGVVIATDYNDLLRPSVVPTIATMNQAHSTHFSIAPDPNIPYVLRGWGEGEVPARHELTVKDVWLRNVTTNTRGGLGGGGKDRNSIFVFEVAGLCIAHLGHLHHPLTEDHLKALGRIDVVLAPVDGSYTLNVDDMIKVLKDIAAPLVIPMHYFTVATLARFTSRLGEHFAIETNATPRITLSRATLPVRPTVLVLPGH